MYVACSSEFIVPESTLVDVEVLLPALSGQLQRLPLQAQGSVVRVSDLGEDTGFAVAVEFGG